MATNGSLKRKSSSDEVNTDDIIYINVKIRFQDGNNLFFRVNRDLELIKVFRDFCNRQKLEYKPLKFIYDGSQIKGNQTAKMLNMENDAEIVALRPQIGGGAAACGTLTIEEDDGMDSI